MIRPTAASSPRVPRNLVLLFSVLLLVFARSAVAEENASNPLAAVSNLDLRLKVYDLDPGDREEFYFDGATMLNPKLKLKYELHYWQTDVTGRDESDWESALVKLLYFPKEGKLDSGKPYRVTVGFDYIVDLGDEDKGTGSGADEIAPLAGVAISVSEKLVLIPLLQHFESVSGNDVSQTSGRFIALRTLENKKWFKADLKLPYDWENETWPASLELQLGKTFDSGIGGYIDAQAGLGGDKPYAGVLGVGLRLGF